MWQITNDSIALISRELEGINIFRIRAPQKPGAYAAIKRSSSLNEQSFLFDSELMTEYQEYQKANIDVHVMIIVAILGTIFYIGRCNIMHSFDDGAYFTYSLLSTSCPLFLYLIHIFGFAVKRFSVEKKNLLHRSSSFIVNSLWLADLFKYFIAISGTLGVSFGLIGRVLNGQCPANVTLWETQRCNPVANASSIPNDHAMYLLMLPLFLQSALNGMTYSGTVICCCVSTITVIICLIHVHGVLEVWTILNSLVILVITYKQEKQARTMFIYIKTTLAAEKEKMEHILLQQSAERNLSAEKAKHEQAILSIEAEGECRLMEKEQQQMVAMIGNVAHDLKTPLQSFLMDLEALKADEGLSQYLELSHKNREDGPKSILQSLESTCCFMSMAINRSIDFAKSSVNIALVPHLETVNLPDALSMAVTVIRHLKSSLEIVVRPFPTTLCPNMITDKHWFKENILCLLSNAVKYSDRGKVTVTITHVTSPALPLSHQVQLQLPEDAHPDLHRGFSTIPNRDSNVSADEYSNTSLPENLWKDLLSDGIQTQVDHSSCPLSSLNFNPPYTESLQETLRMSDTFDGNQAGLILFEQPDSFVPAIAKKSLNCVVLEEVSALNVTYSQSLKCISQSLSALLSQEPSSMIMISVEDEGIGISEGAQENLFQPFKQVQRLAGGTGLGLYSLSNRIQALNGTRGVRSRQDGKQGSLFWFAIPYRPDFQEYSQSSVDSTSSSTPASHLRRSVNAGSTSTSVTQPSVAQPHSTCTMNQRLRFLIVDDSPSILKVLSRALVSKKYDVETADNGSAGLDRLIRGHETRDFDFVLMDLQMPVMDGIEAVRRYREFEAKEVARRRNRDFIECIDTLQPSGSLHLSVPSSHDDGTRTATQIFIIGMSANSDDDTRQCALNAGMNSFIAKPFTIADLLPLLHSAGLSAMLESRSRHSD